MGALLRRTESLGEDSQRGGLIAHLRSVPAPVDRGPSSVHFKVRARGRRVVSRRPICYLQRGHAVQRIP